MLWGCFSAGGTGNLAAIKDGAKYKLQSARNLCLGRKFASSKIISPKHMVKTTNEWLEKKKEGLHSGMAESKSRLKSNRIAVA